MQAPAPLRELVRTLFPTETLEDVTPLGVDAGAGAHEKATGYGQVLLLTLREANGRTRRATLHTAKPNEYGHDRASDRAAEVLLASEDFNRLPRHVRALDVGVVRANGELESLRDAQEFYLIASWAEGQLYVEDLRRLAEGGELTPRDLARCDALVAYLADVHSERVTPPLRYSRSLRDLLGSGEGIFGIIDAYPGETPSAGPPRLQEIERLCLDWRWRLKNRTDRARRTHGDFHPFNLVFAGEAELTALDASRGGAGDPADDITALAINYVFFALGKETAWRRAFSRLWDRFWSGYVDLTGDRELLDVVAPFLAWRALVVASPRFYPDLAPGSRDCLLSLAERALRAPRFDPGWADELFP